jgi:hypothetical protein
MPQAITVAGQCIDEIKFFRTGKSREKPHHRTRNLLLRGTSLPGQCVLNVWLLVSQGDNA